MGAAGKAVEGRARRDDLGQEARGQDGVAEAEAREERLREGAEVDDAPFSVHAGERGERRAGVAELAVVVVLQDPGVGLARPVEEGDAPFHPKHDARGELVGGA